MFEKKFKNPRAGIEPTISRYQFQNQTFTPRALLANLKTKNINK